MSETTVKFLTRRKFIQGLNNYAPSISQQSTPVPPMVLADATTTTTETAATNSTSAAFAATTNNYQPVIDASASLLLQGMQVKIFDIRF